MSRVVIDPGHLKLIDGKYVVPGKRSPQVPPGIYEGEFNWDVALYVRWILRDGGRDAVLTYEKEQRENPTLASRVKAAENADVFVSIHANASPEPGWSNARGSVVFSSPRSMDLGQCIYDELGGLPIIRRRHGPVKNNALYVLRKTDCPSAIVECGFMTNRADAAYMSSANGRAAIGRAIAIGIMEYQELFK